MKKLNLPRKDEEGNCYISHSQVKSFNSDSSYHLGAKGIYEYILGYFFKHKFEDISKDSFGIFGTEAEDYALEGKGAENFTKKERDFLNKLPVLGNTQVEVKYDFGGFYLKGFIDDCDEEMTILDDMKTASEGSSKQYYEDDYKQLDVYDMCVEQMKGKPAKKLRVKVIERLGNPFWNKNDTVIGRDALSVGEQMWIIERKTSPKRKEKIKKEIIETANKIQKFYEVYLELLKIE